MFSFDPVFAFPEWLQFISIIATVCCLQITAYALLNAKWGTMPALQASLWAMPLGAIIGGFLFVGI